MRCLHDHSMQNNYIIYLYLVYTVTLYKTPPPAGLGPNNIQCFCSVEIPNNSGKFHFSESDTFSMKCTLVITIGVHSSSSV